MVVSKQDVSIFEAFPCTCPKRWYHLLTEQEDIPGTSASVCSSIIHTRNLCSSVPCLARFLTCIWGSMTKHAWSHQRHFILTLQKAHMFAEHLLQERRSFSCLLFPNAVTLFQATLGVFLDKICKDRWNHSCLATVAIK